MNLITFTCELDEEATAFIESVDALSAFWEEKGFEVSLFRDAMRPSRFLYAFLTEKSVDELTRFLQEEKPVRDLFERIKENGSPLVVSVMEKVA